MLNRLVTRLAAAVHYQGGDTEVEQAPLQLLKRQLLYVEKRLRFVGKLERNFQQSYARHFKNQARASFISLLFALSLTSITDLIVSPHLSAKLFLVRAGFIAVLLGVFSLIGVPRLKPSKTNSAFPVSGWMERSNSTVCVAR